MSDDIEMTVTVGMSLTDAPTATDVHVATGIHAAVDASVGPDDAAVIQSPEELAQIYARNDWLIAAARRFPIYVNAHVMES